ncbi:MAG: glutamine-hydrolyzing carbamoyl-phosphate synthase small subunit [Burkholderiaceae bacterium]
MLFRQSSTVAPALLALADGTVFQGQSIGANGLSVGEVVFNTAMTGYQEILTDPSYSRQIVTLTYPHIGNVGMNSDDAESTSIHAAGLVIRDLPQVVSNFRSQQNLADALKVAGIVGIAGIDTRRLTRILREKGAQNGALLAGQVGESLNAQSAIDAAKKFPGLKGMDLAKVVTTPKAYRWAQGSWRLGQEDAGGPAVSKEKKFHVVALDFGVKHNILRMLVDRGCAVSVVPAQTSFTEIEALAPDGVFLSNGPGDPEPCDYAIACAKAAMAKRIPLFGICLGHQIMALASGAKTLKMKFGHHGANHPVQDLDTKRVFITSQNHGFAVDPTDLPAALRVTHRSLFDQSIQGLVRTDVPAFCFQGHPEASPGPHDIGPLFDRFIALMLASSAQAGGSRA